MSNINTLRRVTVMVICVLSLSYLAAFLWWLDANRESVDLPREVITLTLPPETTP